MVTSVKLGGLALGLATIVALTGCTDTPTAPVARPDQPTETTLAEFRVVVDSAGMSFEPIVVGSRTASRPEGLSLATYGTQNVDIRLFNNPVVVSTVSGRKRFTADIGLRNLKTFAIGDEQLSSGTIPRDTIGIYIFQSNSVISCAPAVCDVQLLNQHGTGTFTAPNQKYFWYRDRVLAGDTTRANSGCVVGVSGFRGCQWVFDASSNTTSFTFFVQVRASWEPVLGGDTEFSVVYEGDSLPESRAEPRWDITSRSTSATGWTVGEGTALSIIQSSATPNLTREYIRRDSLMSGGTGFMQVTMSQTTTSTKVGTYIIGYFGIDDNSKFLAVGLNKTQVGFITSAFAFIGTPVTTTPASVHTYKIVKNGTGNVELYIDGSGTPAQTLAYTSASWSPSVTLPSNDYSFFFFGHRSGTNGNGTDAPGNSWTTLWDQVVYKLGNTI